jgi:hypothetical protein
LFARQAYVEEHGVPTCPKDLAHHTGLHLNDGGSESRWKLYRKSREEHPINFKPRICSDDMITLKKAAEAGWVSLRCQPIFAELMYATEGLFAFCRSGLLEAL